MNDLDTIKKRDGKIVPFNLAKLEEAILKAGIETGEYGEELAFILAMDTMTHIRASDKTAELTVEDVQDATEDALMNRGFNKTAKAYILYRAERARNRKRSLFKFRKNLRPYEYPELEAYKEAIQHSYWLHTEFNYTSDIHDFKVRVTDAERNAIKNSMLAIAQVEVAVKSFWGDLYHRMPKPELGSVGYTFAANEVIHHDAYSHLLDLLGLNGEFEKIDEIPALKERVDYLTMSGALARTESNQDYTLSLILFSLFIEHVSLFSQFLIIMSFNKHKNLFKGMSNVIEATSKEEQLHGLFGIELVNILREEHPEWFNEDMKNKVVDACRLAYKSESDVIDWIYEEGDLEFLPKELTKEFVKNRLNNSLVSIGYERIFDVDMEAVEETDWFDDEIIATSHKDFFNSRSINYTKRGKSITADDLF